MIDWLMFRADDSGTLKEWNEKTGELLKELSNGEIEGVELSLPTEYNVEDAYRCNLTLCGKIKFTPRTGDPQEYELPLPYHGVFIVQGKGGAGARPSLRVWSSWLTERVGIRKAHLPNGKDEIRIGLPGGGFLVLGSEKCMGDELGASLLFAVKWARSNPEAYPGWLVDLMETHGNQLVKRREALQGRPTDEERKKKVELEEAFGKDVLAQLQEHPLAASDVDDLDARRLMTFPVWLQARLCEVFNRLASPARRNENMGNLAGPEDGAAFYEVLASTLVPVGTFDQILSENIIELAGRLCGVKRCQVGREGARFLPAAYRQNHPSFEKRLCPIESPESEMVGLQLQLARGATIDAAGCIRAAQVDEGGGCQPFVSWGTSLIPFLQHNDGARSMMGAKNLRQAVVVAGAEAPCVPSGGEEGLVAFTKPLQEVGLCPECSDANGTLKIGRDLLVAYLPWYGWNVDDAVVVREGLCKEMAETEERVYTYDIDESWGEAKQLAKEGQTLYQGDVLVEFTDENGKDFILRYGDEGRAKVKSVLLGEQVAGVLRRLRIVVERTFALAPGDKLMGRHGNKGVVSKILPDDEMPTVDGTPVDILLNPHGVLSRMNPGQLLETHLGWLFHHGVDAADVLAEGKTGAVGYPTRGTVDHAKIRDLLAQNGLDRFGRSANVQWIVEGRRVTPEAPVVVGYQHFFRLHHIPSQKAQVRRGGGEALYSAATGQAIRGRQLGGGQRLGEMETWALGAYREGTPILRELLGNADATARRIEGGDRPRLGATGFAQYLHDHLKAMMVEMTVSDGKASFGFLQAASCGQLPLVTNVKMKCRTASFRCESGHAFAAGRRFDIERGNAQNLTLAVFLKAFELELRGILKDENGSYAVEVAQTNWGDSLGKIKVEAADDDGREKTTHVLQVTFPKKVAVLVGMKTLRCSIRCKKGTVAEFLQKTCKPERENGKKNEVCEIGNAKILCPHKDCGDRQRFLEMVTPQDAQPTGSLLDPKIFGEPRERFLPTDDERWGAIKLPVSIPYPVKVLGKLTKEETSAFENMQLSYLPVLPLRYRLPRPGNDDPFGYLQILHAVNGYQRAVWESQSAGTEGGKARSKLDKARNAIRKSVERLFSKLFKGFVGKEGLVRRHGLGRRIDRTCRLVITPCPELALDEVGVPTSILSELLGDRIAASAEKEAGNTANFDNRTCEKGGQVLGWEWQSPEGRFQLSADVRYEELKKYLDAHPHWLVMNRQPSLHKYSVQAFKIVPMKPEDGEVFRLTPLCCKGFAADFDGDEMAGFLPLGAAAQKACAALSPMGNLFSESDRAALVHYDRDFVTGTYLKAEKNAEAAKQGVAELCRAGQADAIMAAARGAFERCTEAGISFGFYDLYDLRREGACAWSVESVKEVLSSALEAPSTENSKAFVASIALSGANGGKQMPQLLDARSARDEKGALVPMTVGQGQGAYEAHLRIDQSLVGGMDWEALFWSSFNARASMCDKKLNTGKAGDLTRRLVYALRPLTIDGTPCACPDAERSVTACRSTTGVCSRCYGTDVHGHDLSAGYPVGLIAAQAIGERGTQLSLKSAHSGGSLVDIEGVRKLLLSGTEGLAGVERLKELDVYKQLDPRHLELLQRAMKMVLGEHAEKYSVDAVLKKRTGQTDFETLAKTPNAAFLKQALLGKIKDVPLDSPAARVMFCNFQGE